MDERIERDLVAAHADSLRHGEAGDFPQRYRELFPRELAEVASLLALAEQLHRLFGEMLTMREPFRQELKAGLLAQAHQQRVSGAARPWRWRAWIRWKSAASTPRARKTAFCSGSRKYRRNWCRRC